MSPLLISSLARAICWNWVLLCVQLLGKGHSHQGMPIVVPLACMLEGVPEMRTLAPCAIWMPDLAMTAIRRSVCVAHIARYNWVTHSGPSCFSDGKQIFGSWAKSYLSAGFETLVIHNGTVTYPQAPCKCYTFTSAVAARQTANENPRLRYRPYTCVYG